YTFSFVNGTLTIVPATPVVAVTCPVGVVFDGNAHACAAAATGVGGVAVSGTLALTYNGAATAPANAGTYTVGAVFASSDTNYNNATGTGLLVIAQATPVVAVSCPPAKFNHHQHGCTATVSGISGGVVAGTLTITYNGSPTPPFAPGSYAVVASFSSAN